MKNVVLGAVALAALPMVASAQSLFTPGTSYPGFYVGAEGGLNWLLNNNSYSMNTGWAAGGKIGYDFVGPRIELEGVYRQNYGTGVVGYPNGTFAFQSGKINQASAMANVLYDFAPGAVITPYVGAALPLSIHRSRRAARCAARSSPIRASWASATTWRRAGEWISMAAITARPTPANTPTTTSR